ncbi:putative zz type zinc finger domain-containing protein [Diaporthe ampelina]|uniref:Putative zz type zinc finger domain-containing protein n=1 Tax=Diaporthe ampelina TaxID=1214573 RepID=A0A0G2HQS0_9PEZI|nr:putative zz type zinc finger domain-containing protein [Diaporthe ampelina]
MASSAPATPDTLVTLKVNFQGSTRRFKLPLRDLGASSLEDKIRASLCIAPGAHATFERYSDSASSYVVLDHSNMSVWKQLYRAAKAKQKLKLRVTLKDSDEEDKGPKPVTVEDEPETENQDFAQSKPEAPLISTAPSEVAEPTKPAPEQSPVPSSLFPTLKDLATSDLSNLDKIKALDQRLEKAMSQLQLGMDKFEQTSPAVQAQAQDSQPAESATSVYVAPKSANFAVCCNNCDRTIPDSHYHCSTCDNGDFDLCPECVEHGITCYSAEHWLIKRFVRGDAILVSTTERIAPKPKELPDREFLHCTSCDDFDLCKSCFKSDQHGHHPKHGFTAAVEGIPLPSDISKRLSPGRNQRHHAICDGCEKFIFGIRHKCLDCPDWDYCADCVVNAGFIHPNHRFVPIYEQLVDARMRTATRPVHYGICCDGPLCNGTRKAYIVGERYKCTVCHDTDFCASCEATPANTHNKTHPLIKFKTPVRRVEVTTKGEDENGQRMPVMGDRLVRHRKSTTSQATETTPSSNIAASSVQTVVDVKPTVGDAESHLETLKKWERAHAEQRENAMLLARKAAVETQRARALEAQEAAASAAKSASSGDDVEKLVAVFERDTVVDGTVLPQNHVFEQTWVLRNAGEIPWPAGCSVKFVGGDYMGHIDPNHPARLHDLVSASESTVCYNSLAPGQEFSFTVLLRTPAREGKVISYWRLTTSDGHKFGHRLWCDVTVQAPKAVEEPKKEEAPTVVKKEVESASETSSQMIFPKLEKESPEASTHEDIKSETAEVIDEDVDDFEDCSEDDDWAEEEDDAFLTDEEYDILDASDEEYLGDQQRKVQRK